MYTDFEGFKIMNKLMITIFYAVSLLFAANASALTLMPGGEFTSGAEFPAYNNPDAADVSTLLTDILMTDTIVDLLYKDNVGGAEEGLSNFQAAYDTTYSNTPTDPADALIEYISGDVMTDASWLLVKGGVQEPSWYLFETEGWNGIDDIVLTGFWPNQGAISHVSIFGTDTSTSVPEPATLLLLSFGLLGFAFANKRKQA